MSISLRLPTAETFLLHSAALPQRARLCLHDARQRGYAYALALATQRGVEYVVFRH